MACGKVAPYSGSVRSSGEAAPRIGAGAYGCPYVGVAGYSGVVLELMVSFDRGTRY